MEARTVSISPEVKQQIATKLTRKEKFDLRLSKAIEYINSKPAGTPIKQREFETIWGLSRAAAAKMLERLVLQKLLIKEKISHFEVTYYPGATQVTTRHTFVDLPLLESMARDYIWQENSNTQEIKNFIGWFKRNVTEYAKKASANAKG